MNKKDQSAAKGLNELRRMLEHAIKTNAEYVELEYEDGDLFVYFGSGNTSFGSVFVNRDLIGLLIDTIVDRAQLRDRMKGRFSMNILGKDYNITVMQYDNFGEPAFNLRIKKANQKNT